MPLFFVRIPRLPDSCSFLGYTLLLSAVLLILSVISPLLIKIVLRLPLFPNDYSSPGISRTKRFLFFTFFPLVFFLVCLSAARFLGAAFRFVEAFAPWSDLIGLTESFNGMAHTTFGRRRERITSQMSANHDESVSDCTLQNQMDIMGYKRVIYGLTMLCRFAENGYSIQWICID